MKNGICCLLTLALLAGFGYAQDCEKTCDAAKTCDGAKASSCDGASVSDAIAKLDAGAEKGCAKSAAKLEAMVKAAGVKDVAELKTHVAAYEKYAPVGCDKSAKMLAALATLAGNAKKPAPVAAPLSERIAKLVMASKAGCAKSTAALKPLLAMHGSECGESFVMHVQTLEAKATEGCAKCVKELDAMETMLPAAKPRLSARVTKLVAAQESGCGKSSAALAPLFAAADTTCCKTLVATIRDLEAKADGGCAKCVAKLADFEAKLAVTKPAAKSGACTKECAECSDCADCAGCPGK